MSADVQSSAQQNRLESKGQYNLMRKSSSNSLAHGNLMQNRGEVQEMLNIASDQGFGLGGKIISGFRFVGNSGQGPLNSRNPSQYAEDLQSCLSELSEFGANRSMMSLSVNGQGSVAQASLALNSMTSFGAQGKVR